jgi:hypothetical protein
LLIAETDTPSAPTPPKRRAIEASTPLFNLIGEGSGSPLPFHFPLNNRDEPSGIRVGLLGGTSMPISRANAKATL